MPTGYTCDVQDGKITTLKDFALKCVRAFGVCATMRENSLDDPIPEEFKPDTFYLTWLEEAKVKLSTFEKLTKEERKAIWNSEYKEALACYEKNVEEQKIIAQRYNDMLDKVNAWQTPSELDSLKSFMRSQLRESYNFDTYVPSKPIQKNFSEWEEDRIASLQRSIRSYEEEWTEEQNRVADRNAYLNTLRECLK